MNTNFKKTEILLGLGIGLFFSGMIVTSYGMTREFVESKSDISGYNNNIEESVNKNISIDNNSQSKTLNNIDNSAEEYKKGYEAGASYMIEALEKILDKKEALEGKTVSSEKDSSSKVRKEKVFAIPDSCTTDVKIAEFLKKQNIISNADEFVSYVRKSGKSKLLKTGIKFTFYENSTYKEVLDILK